KIPIRSVSEGWLSIPTRSVSEDSKRLRESIKDFRGLIDLAQFNPFVGGVSLCDIAGTENDRPDPREGQRGCIGPVGDGFSFVRPRNRIDRRAQPLQQLRARA